MALLFTFYEGYHNQLFKLTVHTPKYSPHTYY